ncbi:MAG: PAS domain S-box protein [Nitrososphaerales archaeon]|jgi:PAS domain S-box-containing protein
MREETEELQASSGVACDKAGLVTSFGLGAAKLLGWKPEEVVGEQNVVVFQELRAVATLVPRLLKTAAEKGKFEAEVTIVRKNGSRFLGLLMVRPIMKRGEIVGYMGLTRHLRNV